MIVAGIAMLKLLLLEGADTRHAIHLEVFGELDSGVESDLTSFEVAEED